MIGKHLDLSSDPNDDAFREDALPSTDKSATGRPGRSYLGVRFRCCDVYARIYVNRDVTAYRGHCPKCSRPVSVRIGPGGSDDRFFEVS